MSPHIYRAVIDEAHQNNLRVAAHIFYLEDAKDLLRSGIDGLAHGVRDQDIDQEFVDLFRERPEVFLMPLLPDSGEDEDPTWLSGSVPSDQIRAMEDSAARITPEQIQERRDYFGIQSRNLARLNEAGVRIGMGTDGNGSGWQFHTEMADMVASGMTPSEVITAATKTSAEIIGLDRLGTLVAGKSADFVVFDANPLDDIRNTQRIARVFLRGEEVDRQALGARWVTPSAETE